MLNVIVESLAASTDGPSLADWLTAGGTVGAVAVAAATVVLSRRDISQARNDAKAERLIASDRAQQEIDAANERATQEMAAANDRTRQEVETAERRAEAARSAVENDKRQAAKTRRRQHNLDLVLSFSEALGIKAAYANMPQSGEQHARAMTYLSALPDDHLPLNHAEYGIVSDVNMPLPRQAAAAKARFQSNSQLWRDLLATEIRATLLALGNDKDPPPLEVQ